MMDDQRGRGAGFRRWLALGIVSAATIVVCGTYYVLNGGSEPINMSLTVGTAAIGLGLLIWMALNMRAT